MSTSNANLYRISVPQTAINYLENTLINTKWKYGKKYGCDTSGTKPCIRINYNGPKYLHKNPLKNCNNNIIKKYGCNNIKAFQASFIFWNEKVPKDDFEISHVCGRFQSPSLYTVGWSSCIEPSHMVVEQHKENIARKSCHHYIRIFKSAILNNENSEKSGKITVEDIRDETTADWRKNIIRNTNIKGSNQYIKGLINHNCKCKKMKCFINYGGEQSVKSRKYRQYILYD